MYRPIPREEIIDSINHLNELRRQLRPKNEREALAHERREAATKTLLTNITRTKAHPTLRALREIADIFSLTIEGAHRLFGYDLSRIRELDLRLNGGRTHIIESYGFERDLLIELPSRLASEDLYAANGMLRNLVEDWQRDIPFRALADGAWQRPGTFYVHVGTRDSLGSSLPAGATALVEPIPPSEQARPNPSKIYLLQFANGYRCSYCVVSRGKLHLLSGVWPNRVAEEIDYPRAVRIAGQVRAFSLNLPSPEYPDLFQLPYRDQGADLILPWEHKTRDRLFATGYRRFERSTEDQRTVRETLEAQLHTKFSKRTERRYRSSTSSQPHIDALIYLTVTHMARYSDALTTSGVRLVDSNRHSLQTLLQVQQLSQLPKSTTRVATPEPTDVWQQRHREFLEWPTLLSLKHPQLQLLQDRVLRVSSANPLRGLAPAIAPGSWMLLEGLSAMPDIKGDWSKQGWSRPIYVLRRQFETTWGYLDRVDNRYVIVSDRLEQTARATFGAEELSSLSRVTAIAVPT